MLDYQENDLSYAELVAALPGGRPIWSKGLSDRAAHALARDGWTPETLRQAVRDGADLGRIPNVGRKVAAEILEWLEVSPNE